MVGESSGSKMIVLRVDSGRLYIRLVGRDWEVVGSTEG